MINNKLMFLFLTKNNLETALPVYRFSIYDRSISIYIMRSCIYTISCIVNRDTFFFNKYFKS